MYEITTGGIICLDQKTQKFLLMKSRWNEKRWSFPKGYVNKNEEVIDAALRELYEESQISLSKDDLLEKTYIIRVKLPKPTKKIPSGIKVIKFWIAHLSENIKITLSREHSKYTWTSDFEDLNIIDEFTELSNEIKKDLFS